MSNTEAVIIIFLVSLVTFLIRFIPFLIFRNNRTLPPFVQYLNTVLPYACIGMLVVYCFKSVDLTSGNHGLPELISALFVIAVHHWKHQMLLSIAGGTLVYMLLVQLVF